MVVLLLLALAYILVEWYRPQPVDWSRTYINTDKIPYGTYALFSLLDETFPGKEINSVRVPAYNLLGDSTISGNYIFIGPRFDLQEPDLAALLDFAKNGNTVFIAAEMYGKAFADSLDFRVETGITASDSLVHFLNPTLGSENYVYDANSFSSWFTEADTLNTVKIAASSSGKTNFIRTRYGKGTFYLHSQPAMFSNYHLLRNKGHEYVFRAISYLPELPVWWDEYYKQGRQGSNSILGVIARYPSLRWAWYLLLGGLLLFIVFGGKRRQRVIPVMKPLDNTSLEFTRVVSSLYYNQQDFKDIALKKIRYFREFIRNRYQESPEGPDAGKHFTTRLAAKSGLDEKTVDALFRTISYTEAADFLSEAELHSLSGRIEDFYSSHA